MCSFPETDIDPYFPRLVMFYNIVLNQLGTSVLAPVVQSLDNAIHRINHYPVDKY